MATAGIQPNDNHANATFLRGWLAENYQKWVDGYNIAYVGFSPREEKLNATYMEAVRQLIAPLRDAGGDFTDEGYKAAVRKAIAHLYSEPANPPMMKEVRSSAVGSIVYKDLTDKYIVRRMLRLYQYAGGDPAEFMNGHFNDVLPPKAITGHDEPDETIVSQTLLRRRGFIAGLFGGLTLAGAGTFEWKRRHAAPVFPLGGEALVKLHGGGQRPPIDEDADQIIKAIKSANALTKSDLIKAVDEHPYPELKARIIGQLYFDALVDGDYNAAVQLVQNSKILKEIKFKYTTVQNRPREKDFVDLAREGYVADFDDPYLRYKKGQVVIHGNDTLANEFERFRSPLER